MEPDYHSEEQKENTHIHVMRERDHTFENITPNIYLVGLTNEISYTSTMKAFVPLPQSKWKSNISSWDSFFQHI